MELTLKQALKTVGVDVVKLNPSGVALHDARTGEKLHETPRASTYLGWEIYQQRISNS